MGFQIIQTTYTNMHVGSILVFCFVLLYATSIDIKFKKHLYGPRT